MKINLDIRILIILGFVIFVSLGSIIYNENEDYKNEQVMNNPHKVIAKVIKQYRTHKLHEYIRYEYDYKGKTYSEIQILDRQDENEYEGKYFQALISKINPSYSIIDLTQEITNE